MGKSFSLEAFVDRQGYLWFGTFGGGMSRYDGNRFAAFTAADELVDDDAQALLEDLPLNLAQAERTLINRALTQINGNVAKAARLLGIKRMKIYRKLATEPEEDAD